MPRNKLETTVFDQLLTELERLRTEVDELRRAMHENSDYFCKSIADVSQEGAEFKRTGKLELTKIKNGVEKIKPDT